MTFVFIGLDGFDYNIASDCNFNEEIKDTPVHLQKLRQDLPDVISEKGNGKDPTGHWTFYVWPAIASGQIQTPEMRQNHPSPSNVEYPLKWRYYRDNVKALKRYVSGRLKRRARYKSFVFDDFENVKVINYPLHLPEYNRNADLIRNDAISRDYGPLEMKVLATEINEAIKQNYDAVFVVTRKIDCHCHGATSPANYGSEDVDEWFNDSIGKSFDEVHESGMDIESFAEEDGELDISDSHEKEALELKKQILDHVENEYQEAADLIKAVNWDGVDEHMVISDHGFQSLGAGSVKAHGRDAVLSCSFGYWRKISGLIPNWREALENAVEENDSESFEGKSTEEKVKEDLEKLGYNV